VAIVLTREKEAGRQAEEGNEEGYQSKAEDDGEVVVADLDV